MVWIIMKRLPLLALPLLCATAAFAAEPAVQLEVMAGKVLKQSAAGFTKAKSGTPLKAGDRLMLREGAAAILNAAESGCFVSLREAGLYVVPDLANCTPGQTQVLASQAKIEPVNGIYEPVYPEEPGYPPPPMDPGIGLIPPPPPPIAAAPVSGVLVAGGFVSIIAAATLYSTVIEKDEPVSGY
jgi:hypothetical protein